MKITRQNILHIYFNDLSILCLFRRMPDGHEPTEKVLEEGLSEKENIIAKDLMQLKQNNKEEFEFQYKYFASQIIERAKRLEQNETNDKALERLKRIFFALDTDLFKSCFEKEKTTSQQLSSVIELESNPQPIIEQPQPSVNEVKVISGTQGLADYLGCSKSMAFGIISKGVLKDIGVQYMVGKCWKFNREKLDKYLKEHPDLLANVRCKR